MLRLQMLLLHLDDWSLSVVYSRSGAPTSEAPSTGSTAASTLSFDFQTAMRRSDDESNVGDMDENRFKKKGKGKLQVIDGKVCSISTCDGPAAATSQYCWRHKRGHGRVVKFAMKGKKSNSSEYQAYVKIFGEGRNKPEDPALAERVIVDVTDAMPDDEVLRLFDFRL